MPRVSANSTNYETEMHLTAKTNRLALIIPYANVIIVLVMCY